MDNGIEQGDKPCILAIDDTPANLDMIGGLLRGAYRVKVASSGERGLKLAFDARPDLILLDIVMEGMGGYEVCRRLKAEPETRDIPVIFLTARTDVEDEEKGLALGAVDYITKPISPAILRARIRTHLTLKASADFLKNQNQFLEDEVAKRTREVQAIQKVTTTALASLAETRDNETGNHILRTQHYIKELAKELKDHPRFRHFLNPQTIELLFLSAPLHDIGKVGIPDHILLKPGPLTQEEFEVMKTHSTLGCGSIEIAERRLGERLPFLEMAKEISRAHHEKWNGRGYPDGLAGEDIPIAARLMAVADVYDALIGVRVYKGAMSHEEAARIIIEGRGTDFDPDVVDAFVRLQERFRSIAASYRDSHEG